MKQKRVKIIRHGGSAGITIPARYLKESQLKVGDELSVTFDDVLFYLKPVEPREPKEQPDENEK